MYKSLYPIFLFLLILACKPTSKPVSSSQSAVSETVQPKQTEEEKIILSLRQRYNEAIHLHDTMGITTVWGKDYEMLTSRNQQIKGIENNRRSFAKEFAANPSVKYTRTPKEIVPFSQWRMASEYGTWVGQRTEADGLVTIKGTYYAKWHFTGHEWKLRMEVFTAISCDGSKFCDEVPILEEAVNY